MSTREKASLFLARAGGRMRCRLHSREFLREPAVLLVQAGVYTAKLSRNAVFKLAFLTKARYVARHFLKQRALHED